MTSYLALLRLQLLSRFADLKPRNLVAQLRARKGRTIGMLIAYLVAFGYMGAFLIFIEMYMLDFFMSTGMPDMLLSVAVTLSMMGTLVMSFFFIMSALYFGRDAAFIAALPVKPRTVLSAKLTQVWISEVGFSLLIILPAAILYGIRVGPDALFYLRALIAALFAPVLPIVIVSFVSTVLVRFSVLWKHRDMIATVSGIVFIMAYMFFAFNMGSMNGSGEAADFVAQFMQSNITRIESMTRVFPPAGWAAKGMLGDWGSLLLFLIVCAAAAVFTVWAVGFWYQKLSMLQGETPTETKKGGIKNASFAGSSAFKALCLRETRQIIRVPSYATNSLPTALMPVFMVGMLYFVMNNALSQDGQSLEMLLKEVDTGLVLPILTAVMAYMAGMNPALSTSVSREGKGHDFMNALPVSSKTIILSKLTVGYSLSLVGVLASAVLLAILVPGFALHAALAFLLCALYTFLTACLALARDVKKPKLDWVTEQEAIKQNFGAAIGMFLGWAILIALAGVTVGLFLLNINMYLYFAVMAVLLGVSAFLAYRYLMKTAGKYYCAG